MLRLTALIALAILGVTSAVAHPELEEALVRLNAQIALTPEDAGLYLDRGELYAQHADPLQAEANFLRAAELQPRLPRLDQLHGKLALAQRDYHDARLHLDRALALDRNDTTAYLLRARTHTALENRAAALADYDAAFARLASVRPELVLEQVALLSPAEGLVRLDHAIERTGPAPALVTRALELELALGRTDAALHRLDRLAAASERKEFWLKRRGDILQASGRTSEAVAAYAAAESALASLPEWLRESPEVVNLSAELRRLTAHRS